MTKNKDGLLDFGDYCSVEQKRFGAPNEFYGHKVIRSLESNAWMDVPVSHDTKMTTHDNICEVVECICIGVDETRVLRYRRQDVRGYTVDPKQTLLEKLLLGNDKVAFRLYGTDTPNRETIQVYAMNDEGMYVVRVTDDLHEETKSMKYLDSTELKQYFESKLS